MIERKYNIKTVTLLTGINEHTLRAWETRYQAIVPKRSETGRREYTQSDVDRIRSLMALSENGHAISSIAGLAPEEICRLTAETGAGNTSPSARQVGRDPVVSFLLTLTTEFKLIEIQAQLRQSLNKFGAEDFILRLISPLMAEVGALTTGASISIAQEHAVSAIVRAMLFELFFSFDPIPGGKNASNEVLLFVTMEGDQHELGILCAAILGRVHGYNCTYIGPNTPPEALALAANALDATAIVIGSVDIHASILRYQPDAYIGVIQALLKRKCRIVLGTSSRSVAAGLIPSEDLILVNSLAAFVQLLDKFSETKTAKIKK